MLNIAICNGIKLNQKMYHKLNVESASLKWSQEIFTYSDLGSWIEIEFYQRARDSERTILFNYLR
jgi:hypothetical protein